MPWTVQVCVPFRSEEEHKAWVAHCKNNGVSSRKAITILIKNAIEHKDQSKSILEEYAKNKKLNS